MSRFKKILGIISLTVFVLSSVLVYMPVNAAAAVPKIDFVSAPVTEYTAGDRVRFDIHAPNYGGRVEYRVVLWEDSKKTYHDLWNAENGYPNRYYTKWQPYGNNTFTLGWPIFEPGSYRITVYVKRLGLSNSKTALKGMNCDSYKESAAFVVKPKTLETTPIVLDKDNQTYGSAEPGKPETVKADVKITGKNITYNNASIDGNLYISSDNAVLNNINVGGTVFIDPGKEGSASLNNVNAKSIKVLSGAQNSIHLKNVTADDLNVESVSKARLVLEGTTRINRTLLSSSAILDNEGGTFGNVTVSKGINGKSEIELSGKFSGTVTVGAEAVIKAAQGADVAKLVIALENKNDIAALQGSFNDVEISKEARIFIDGSVKNIYANAKASIDTAINTVIEVLNENGNSVQVTGDGKVIQDNTGGLSGGGISIPGGTGSVPGGEIPDQPLAIEGAGVVLSDGTELDASRSGSEYYVDLSGYARTIGVRFSLNLNRDCDLNLKQVIINGIPMDINNEIPFSAHDPKVIGPEEFGMKDNDPPGISLGTIRDSLSGTNQYYTVSLVLSEGTNSSLTMRIRMKVK